MLLASKSLLIYQSGARKKTKNPNTVMESWFRERIPIFLSSSNNERTFSWTRPKASGSSENKMFIDALMHQRHVHVLVLNVHDSCYGSAYLWILTPVRHDLWGRICPLTSSEMNKFLPPVLKRCVSVCQRRSAATQRLKCLIIYYLLVNESACVIKSEIKHPHSRNISKAKVERGAGRDVCNIHFMQPGQELLSDHCFGTF